MFYNNSKVTHQFETCNSFLTLLGDAPWLFQTFDDDSNRKDKSLTRQFYGSLDEHWDELVALNERGAGVFVTVNKTNGASRKADNIMAIRALFIDCDNGLPSEFHCSPTMVVNSSRNGKGHAYWVLSEPSLDVNSFTAHQQKLINYYASDKAVKDLPRVMRLPGLFHTKNEPTLVTFNKTGERYTSMNDITDALTIKPARPDGELLTTVSFVPSPINNEFQLLLAELLTASEGERNNKLNAVAFKAGRLVKAGKLADDVVREQLTNVAGIIGLSCPEASATIESGMCAGLMKQQQPTDKRSKSNVMRDRLNQFFNDEHLLQWDEMKNKLRFDGSHVSVEKLHDITEWELDLDLPFENFKRTAAVNAMTKPYHAVREYLTGLTPISDKAERDTVLTNLYTAMGISDDNILYQTYVRRWLVSAVNRAMVPGCKADVALILKGTQGIGKTTFFERLFSKEYFQTVGEHKSDVDALLAMNRSWCIEMGEIENAFSRKAVSAIKNFMSITSDTYRRPYAAEADDYPRHFIICGTTNEDKFLSDGTGNRRFWVIDCGDRAIDLASVEKNRDAIWSAVLWLYQNGEQGYLTKTEAVAAADDVKSYEDDNPWLPLIAAYMTQHNPCTVADIMMGALEFDKKNLNDKKAQASLTSVLKKLGCSTKRTTHNGVRAYYWYRPDSNITNADDVLTTTKDVPLTELF